MKIKQSSKISTKKFIMLFIIASLISVILRCIQTAKYIDPDTGFYSGGTVITVLLYILLFAAFVTFVVISYISKETADVEILEIKSVPLSVVTAIFSASLFYDCVYSLFKSSQALANTSAFGGVQAMMASGFIPLVFQSIFAFFSGVYFTVVAGDYRKGSSKSTKFKVLALAPVGWTGFRLIHRFISQISFVEVSDLFLELILLGFMIMFFMSFAQVSSGVYSTGFAWRISGFGLSSGLVGIVLSMTRFIFMFVNAGEYVNAEYPFQLCDFAFSLFVVILNAVIINKKDADKDEFYGRQI